MANTILDQDLEQVIKPCRIHLAIKSLETFAFVRLCSHLGFYIGDEAPAQKTRRGNRNMGPYKVDEAMRQQMQADRNSGMILEDMRRKYGISTSTIKTYTSSPHGPAQPKISVEAIQQIHKLLDEGYSQSEVAQMLGVSRATVQRRAQKGY